LIYWNLKFKVIGIHGSMTKEFSGSSDLKQKQSQWWQVWFFLNLYLYALMRFRWKKSGYSVYDILGTIASFILDDH